MNVGDIINSHSPLGRSLLWYWDELSNNIDVLNDPGNIVLSTDDAFLQKTGVKIEYSETSKYRYTIYIMRLEDADKLFHWKMGYENE